MNKQRIFLKDWRSGVLGLGFWVWGSEAWGLGLKEAVPRAAREGAGVRKCGGSWAVGQSAGRHKGRKE